jgi:protein-disulfide isomerase
MHHLLMTTDEWQKDTNWVGLAERVGVPDTGTFRRCINGAETRARIEADGELAKRLKIEGTPAFFAQSRTHIGGFSMAALQKFASYEK